MRIPLERPHAPLASRRRHSVLPLCIAGGLLATSAPASGGEGDEQETLVDCAVLFEPFAMPFGATAINGAISPSTDLDTFVVCAQGGETLEVCLDAVGSCTNWDPFVRVFDPANVLVASTSCGTDCTFGPGSCSACVGFTALVAGCYSIVVSDSGTDQTGAFRLHVEEVAPTRKVPVLPYSFARLVTLGPTTDNDWLRFFGKGGSTITVQVDQQGACTSVDPRFTLYAPNGDEVDTGACGTDCTFGPGSCSISRQVTLPAQDGPYTLRLRDDGEDDTGTVLVSVECLFGCPPLNQSLSRNGSGVNPATYEVRFPTVSGECWSAEVDATDQPGARFSTLLLALGPGAATPAVTRFGEYLLDPAASRLCNHMRIIPPTGIARHTATIPTDPALLGVVISTQSVTSGSSVKLRNAIDYLIGY